MGIIESIKQRNRHEQFMPSALGMLFNPNYINRRAIHDGLKRHAPALKGDLLDFGCGAKPYRSLFDVDRYVGVDLDQNEGHDLPRDKTDFFYDGTSLPFEDDTFDSVYSSEVFEHIFNLPQILQEISRVHKRGGLLLVTMPFVWPEHEMPNDFGRYTSAGARSILETAGYEIVEHSTGPGFFLTLVQLTAAYAYRALLPKSNTLKFAFAPLVSGPITAAGLLLDKALPHSGELFMGHIILARNMKKRA